jgi:hypothetical protein
VRFQSLFVLKTKLFQEDIISKNVLKEMDIKKTYQDMLTSLGTDDAKEAWEVIEDKTTREAAEFIYKVVKAYESIRDEIRQDMSMAARYPEYRFQTRNENYDYVEDVGNSYIIEVYFYESNKVVAKNIYFCPQNQQLISYNYVRNSRNHSYLHRRALALRRQKNP